MRNLSKIQEPQVLIDHEEEWLAAVADNPQSEHHKTKYRHDEIKGRLREETSDKCVYCESKMLPVTPAQIEHKIPTSVDETLRFHWSNLTLACPECNRRKNNFYDEHEGFLDPYSPTDNVEDLVRHHGPIATWKVGVSRAELSIKFLGLDGGDRPEIIIKKAEKFREIDDLVERYMEKMDSPIGPALKKRLAAKGKKDAEYSAMVRSIFVANGLDDLL